MVFWSMPLVPYDKQIEPPDDAEIWRFMDMDKFRDLMANEELYFCRTDLYKKDDPNVSTLFRNVPSVNSLEMSLSFLLMN